MLKILCTSKGVTPNAEVTADKCAARTRGKYKEAILIMSEEGKNFTDVLGGISSMVSPFDNGASVQALRKTRPVYVLVEFRCDFRQV